MIQQSYYFVFTKRIQEHNSKGNIHPYVYRSIIYKSQEMEAAQVSIDWWMEKEDMV